MSLKLNDRVTTQQFYKKYKYYSQPKSIHHIKDYKVYKAILKDFFSGLSELIMNDAYTYKIPHGFGRVYIKKYKWVNRPVDWFNTKKYGKVIYHNNNHSGGYGSVWWWSKKGTLAKGLSLYRFKATRTNNRDLAKVMQYSDIYKDYKED